MFHVSVFHVSKFHGLTPVSVFHVSGFLCLAVRGGKIKFFYGISKIVYALKIVWLIIICVFAILLIKKLQFVNCKSKINLTFAT